MVTASIMGHQRQSSYESFCSILSCKSDDFEDFYKGGYTTAQLVSDVQKDLLDKHLRDLEPDHRGISTYKLLTAMLEHAPSESGKRYVATVLHIAYTGGGLENVKKVADAWLENMFMKSEQSTIHLLQVPDLIFNSASHFKENHN